VVRANVIVGGDPKQFPPGNVCLPSAASRSPRTGRGPGFDDFDRFGALAKFAGVPLEELRRALGSNAEPGDLPGPPPPRNPR